MNREINREKFYETKGKAVENIIDVGKDKPCFLFPDIKCDENCNIFFIEKSKPEIQGKCSILKIATCLYNIQNSIQEIAEMTKIQTEIKQIQHKFDYEK